MLGRILDCPWTGTRIDRKTSRITVSDGRTPLGSSRLPSCSRSETLARVSLLACELRQRSIRREQRDYMLASALSVIPGQISLVAIGNFISFPNLLNGIIVAVAWIVVFGLTIWAYRRWKAAKEDEEASRDDGANR